MQDGVKTIHRRPQCSLVKPGVECHEAPPFQDAAYDAKTTTLSITRPIR